MKPLLAALTAALALAFAPFANAAPPRIVMEGARP